jgi:membrane-bound lytic murein transglycosylase F
MEGLTSKRGGFDGASGMRRFAPSFAAHAAAFIAGVVVVATLGCQPTAPPPPPPPVVAPPPEDPEIKEVAPAAPPPPPPLVKETGDLAVLKKRGTLRILVFGENARATLPRAAATANHNESMAEQLAEHLGLVPEVVSVDAFADLIPALLDGRGDVIASRLTITPARKAQVAFTRATNVVDEVVVVKAGAAAPAAVADLAGMTITVRHSSAYRETLESVQAKEKIALTVVEADEKQDTERIALDVADGKVAATVIDSDLLESIQSYNDRIAAGVVIKKNREVALALRPTNTKLKAAADAWLVSRAIADHRADTALFDLPAIKKRGSIRLLTRNNAVSYFLYKGTQQGFDYEMVRLFAREQGLRVDVVVPPDAKDLIPWLLAGKGDVIAAQMTVTPERAAQVAFTPPYLLADELVVQPASAAPFTTLADLKGKTIHVRASSSYRQTLDALQATAGPFAVVDAPESMETEVLIGEVAAGRVPLTVADSGIAAVEGHWQKGAVATLPLASGREIALASRADAPALKKALAAFVDKHVHRGDDGKLHGSVDYNVLRKMYFDAERKAAEAQEDFKETGKISPYDDIIRRVATEHGIDWRLMAAQAYQESRFDPNAKSWVGALGLFQVMPKTGAEMGFTKLHDPEEGARAGVRYMAQLIDSFEKSLPFKQRVRFALAAYNAGRGHVEDARRLAKDMGLNPDKWFKNVEVAMLRLQEPAVARKMRYGYCRGEEPVKYVSEIQSRYDNYLSIVPDPGSEVGASP